jgi:putative transposase
MARIMIAGLPYHVTHRGNQRAAVFTAIDHYRDYLSGLERYSRRFGMEIWAYCLMPNHVHLVAVGREARSVARVIGNAHRSFSARRNRDCDVTGHLWANRYFSTVLDETHLWAAVRYVELNPVRARLVEDAIGYRWSSARAHAGLGEPGPLHPDRPFPGPIADWESWLRTGLDEASATAIRRNTSTGRPTGSPAFLEEIERRCGRPVRPRERRAPRDRPPGTGKVSPKLDFGKRPRSLP